MKRVLITGVTGFIGSSLVREFHGKKGIFLAGYSRDTGRAAEQFPGIDLALIDELSTEQIDQNKIDTIIHLAGIAHDLSGQYQPDDYYRVNYQQTRQLFDAFAKSTASTFVFVSSVKAVTDHPQQVITEQTPAHPETDYGKSKKMAEEYMIVHQPGGKKVIVLRPGMVHGPGNKGNLNLLYKLMRKRMPYPFGAFDNRRTFLSIDNFVFVIDKILQDMLPGGIYMLADSEPLSTVELVRLMAGIMQRRAMIWRLPKAFIRAGAGLGSMLHLPFNKQTLQKLTGDMVISNEKLLLTLGEVLPVSSRQGIEKTIRSMHG